MLFLLQRISREAIYTRNRLKNKFIKNPSVLNEKLYKIQRNKCFN